MPASRPVRIAPSLLAADVRRPGEEVASLAAVEPVPGLCDLVLAMAVIPAFGGQSFPRWQLAGIAALRGMIDAAGRDVALPVDGGVTTAAARDSRDAATARDSRDTSTARDSRDTLTARDSRDAGAGMLVAGATAFGATGYAAAIAGLRG